MDDQLEVGERGSRESHGGLTRANAVQTGQILNGISRSMGLLLTEMGKTEGGMDLGAGHSEFCYAKGKV